MVMNSTTIGIIAKSEKEQGNGCEPDDRASWAYALALMHHACHRAGLIGAVSIQAIDHLIGWVNP